MATEYRKATDNDFDELRDLANYVFKLDFEELLPKLYRPEYKTAHRHHIALEDGRIKSVVGSFPMELNAAGHKLNVAGIGTVAVHPYTRRRGYMKVLMTQAMEEMEEQGIDLGCLGGARQRYAYFGFEPSGQQLQCEVTQANLRHTFGVVDAGTLTLEKVHRDDARTIDTMKALHDSQPLHVTRTVDLFFDTLCSYKSVVYAAKRGGEVVGYLASSEDHSEVRELVLADGIDLAHIVGAFFTLTGRDRVNFICWPWNVEQVRFFESIAERLTVTEDFSFAILNYRSVVAAMMDLKAAYTTLCDGTFTLHVEGKGAIRIAVQGGKPEVTDYDGPCDITLPPLKATRLLFSPVSGIYDFGLQLPAAVRQWLPLPLCCPQADEV